MYSLILENKDGLQLEFNSIGANYNITNAQGLSPAKATINTNTAALIDGATFNSAKVNMRSINLAFTIENPVEANRLNVYKVLRAKEPITLYYKSNLLDVYIKGYVESIDIGHFDVKQKATVAILCPFPYFSSAQAVINELTSIINMFHFPFWSVASKNRLIYPYDYTTRTRNGVTFTDNGDGTITVNGTATAYTDFPMQGRIDTDSPFSLPDGEYIVSGCPEGGSSTTYRILVGITGSNGSWQTIAADSGSGATFTYNSSMGYLGVVIAVYQGATVSNVTFSPMIRSSSVQDSSWQPYYAPDIVFGAIDTEAKAEVANNGGIETGLIFELYAKQGVSNPKIFNYMTSEYIGLNFDMQAGDLITINTMQGQKSITLLRNAVETNIFNSLQKGSTWLQLASNGSIFVYEVGSGSLENLEVDIQHNDLFEGV